MGSTIDGLVSGLNTTQIIQQLMAVERLPEQQLTQGKTDASNRVSVLQSLNSLVAALRTASTAFAPDSVLTKSAWASTVATSSNTALATALASSTATPGSATFTVKQIATAGSSVSSGTVSSTTAQVATGPVLVSKGVASVGFTSIDASSGLGSSAHSITVTAISGTTDFDVLVDGTAHNTVSGTATGKLTLQGAGTATIDVTLSGALKEGSASTTSVNLASGATLADVAKAISASAAGVQATAVGLSSTAYKLQLSSTTTGAASDVTLNPGAFGTSGLGTMQQLTAGTDTVLHVGTGVGAYDVTSATNTVSTLLPGVTITALKADPATPVSINVTSDSSGMADKMKALVDAANAALSFIDRNSAYDSDSKTAQPLLGNSMVSELRQRITDAVIGTSADTPAMNGVSVQRDGTIAFDRQKFLDAYAKDPVKVQTTMTAMSQSIYDLSKDASDSGTGYLTAQITSEQNTIKDYTKQIAAFEDRMTLRQQTLQTQYAALETMLGKLQSQSQWLSGQLASLTTPSTSGK